MYLLQQQITAKFHPNRTKFVKMVHPINLCLAYNTGWQCLWIKHGHQQPNSVTQYLLVSKFHHNLQQADYAVFEEATVGNVKDIKPESA